MEKAGIAEIEWRVEPARSGAPTLRLGGRYAHSRYDPQSEAKGVARRILEAARAQRAGALVLIGSGLGYVVDALRGRAELPILLWEPFPALARALAVTVEPDAALQRVEDPEAFRAALRELARRGLVPYLQVHPGYEEPCRFEARLAAWELRRVFHASRPLWIEEAVVSRRAIDFLARFPTLRTLDSLGSALVGQTAVLVSPGPSLDAALPILARRRGGAVIAAFQALRPLASARVSVDFALAPDPGNYEPHWTGFEPSFRALLAESSVDPVLLDRWADRTLLFHLRTPHLHEVAWRACGLPILDEPFVTVSEIAVVLAHRLGARRLLLVGMDFHSDGERYPVRFRACSRSGEAVTTNSTYLHAARYLGWLCPRLARGGIEIGRFGDGLPVAGTRTLDASELERWVAEAPPFSFELPPARPQPERWKRVHDLLRSVASGAGGTHRGHSRVTGLHPDAPALRPLGDEERIACCETALERLAAYAPGD